MADVNAVLVTAGTVPHGGTSRSGERSDPPARNGADVSESIGDCPDANPIEPVLKPVTLALIQSTARAEVIAVGSGEAGHVGVGNTDAP